MPVVFQVRPSVTSACVGLAHLSLGTNSLIVFWLFPFRLRLLRKTVGCAYLCCSSMVATSARAYWVVPPERLARIAPSRSQSASVVPAVVLENSRNFLR